MFLDGTRRLIPDLDAWRGDADEWMGFDLSKPETVGMRPEEAPGRPAIERAFWYVDHHRRLCVFCWVWLTAAQDLLAD